MAVRAMIEERTADIVQFPGNGNDTEVRPNNKKKGQKSEVYPYKTGDLEKMTNYFLEHGAYQHWLILELGYNTARRIGDILSFTWGHIFDPKTGEIREHMKPFSEEKTGKFANPKINEKLNEIIRVYVEKTGVDITRNNYEDYVFIQLSGTYAGRLITEDGHLKALKKAAVALGIDYNIGTHSARKTFGRDIYEAHPNDPYVMPYLQGVYNHSDPRITRRYIGLEADRMDSYYDYVGEAHDRRLKGESVTPDGTTCVCLDVEDIRNAVKQAFKAGKGADALDESDMDKVDAIMQMLYQCKR